MKAQRDVSQVTDYNLQTESQGHCLPLEIRTQSQVKDKGDIYW